MNSWPLFDVVINVSLKLATRHILNMSLRKKQLTLSFRITAQLGS